MQTVSAQIGEEWKDFFVAAAGASATLVSLVIVAISVNLQRILEHPQLPSRGGATVAALVLILVSSMAELIPQTNAALAIEILVSGLLVWLLQIWSARQNHCCVFEVSSNAAEVGGWNSHRSNQGDSFHRWGNFFVFPSGKRTVLDSVGDDRHLHPLCVQYVGAPGGDTAMNRMYYPRNGDRGSAVV
jgi:hypothetical protein